MQTPRFQKRVEDFTCEHCAARIAGTGYTNHCPKCLWSKHVDINPGDRAAACGGMMEPVRLEGGSPSYDIVHRCLACGLERRNAVAKGDAPDAVVQLARKNARLA